MFFFFLNKKKRKKTIIFIIIFFKLPQKKCPGGRRQHRQRPQSVFEKDGAVKRLLKKTIKKVASKRCPTGRRLQRRRPQSVLEEDEAEEAAESSSPKCWPGYSYFVQLNRLWKVEFSTQIFFVWK